MANVYQTVITYNGAGQLFSNVLHINISESGGHRPDEYAAKLNDGVENSYLGPILDCMSATVNVASIASKRVTDTGGIAITKTYGPTELTGTRDGSIGNTSENVCLEFPVLLNGKNVTGKVFISGILDSDIIDNELVDTIKTRASAVGTTLLGTYTLDGGHGTFHYVVFNRANKFFASPTFHRLSPVVGSQRRRLRP